LVELVKGDKYLILHGKDEDGIDNIGDTDIDTGVPIIKHLFNKPPKSSEVRDYLSSHPELFTDDKLLGNECTLPLSLRVRKYIYENQLYKDVPWAGNLTDMFRNVFDVGLAEMLGRVPKTDTVVNQNVIDKLNLLGIVM